METWSGSGFLGTILPFGSHGSMILTYAKHALSEEHVTASGVDVVVAGVSGGDHETVDELHGLGSLTAQLARHHPLAPLRPGLHDEAQYTVARTPHCESTDELVPQRLGLRDSAQTPRGHLLGVQLDGALGEVEALLHHGGQLADAPALLSEHVLCARGHDDDLGPGGGNTDFHAGVAILSELTGEELVQLGLEDAVGNELSLFRNLGCHDCAVR